MVDFPTAIVQNSGWNMADMTSEKIISVIEMYEGRLAGTNVPKTPMDPKRTFGSLSKDELLAHAHALCEDAKRYARDPELRRKAGSFLTSIQMCLSSAGWYTLEELKEHNRPDQGTKEP